MSDVKVILGRDNWTTLIVLWVYARSKNIKYL